MSGAALEVWLPLSFDQISQLQESLPSSLSCVALGNWYFIELHIFFFLEGFLFFSIDEQATCKFFLFFVFFYCAVGCSVFTLTLPGASVPTSLLGSWGEETSGDPGWLFSQCLEVWRVKGSCHGLRPILHPASSILLLVDGEAALMHWKKQ